MNGTDLNLPIHKLYGAKVTLYSCVIDDSLNGHLSKHTTLRHNPAAAINDAYGLYSDMWRKLVFDNVLHRGPHGHFVDANGIPILTKERFINLLQNEGAQIQLLHKRITFKMQKFDLELNKQMLLEMKLAEE